jgi:hypothetical protein
LHPLCSSTHDNRVQERIGASVKLSAALAADLAMLTEALAEPGTDIEQTLRTLTADAAAATASFAGLTAAVFTQDRWTTITSVADGVAPAEVVTSIRIPLSERAYVILYASRPGAFVDLAADLSWITGQSLAEFVLDDDALGVPALLAADTFGGGRVVDQALGVLIARGRTPDEASAELDDIARNDGGSRVVAARVILDALDADGGAA